MESEVETEVETGVIQHGPQGGSMGPEEQEVDQRG